MEGENAETDTTTNNLREELDELRETLPKEFVQQREPEDDAAQKIIGGELAAKRAKEENAKG